MTIDIGNTHIVTALFYDSEIIHEWRIHSDTQRTADEYCSILLSLFRDAGVSQNAIQSAILSSVVPLLIGPFINVVQKITGKKPLIVTPALFDKLPIQIPQTAIHEIGSDIVCNIVEAWSRFKSPCIVLDFGTALTFTAVSADGFIQGVAITPGLGTALNSLFKNTAQLPSVPLEQPPDSLGTNTIHSIQSGILLGYKGLVESLVSQMSSDMCKKTGCATESIHIIATGGLNSVLKPITDIFQVVDKQLTLKGLHRIAMLFASENMQ